MKKTIFFILLFPAFMIAQKSGKVIYDKTTKVEIPDRVPKEFRDQIPKEFKSKKELFFDESVSLYKNGEMEKPEDAEVADGGGGRRIRMRFRGGGQDANETFKDLTSSNMVDKRNLMGKDFIIKDVVPQYEWKITGNKKQILSYLVMEATTTVDDSISVSAWFTPQIPISNGPGVYQGLPGLILEMNIDNGKEIIIANSVELGPIDASLIEKPKKGKEVTQEEFREIRKEKMKERRGQRGGRQGIRIRTGGQ